MTGARRLSQAISEGDGISVLLSVAGADEARSAEAAGAKAVLTRPEALPEVREATTLPVVSTLGPGDEVDGEADAWLVAPDRELVEWLGDSDVAVRVESEEQLEQALEELDPELLVLAPGDGVEAVLELLADVPAGKLVIAELAEPSEEQIEELERAGVDAVLVRKR